MADSTTPSKIKQLFSSFLSNLVNYNKFEGNEKNIDPNESSKNEGRNGDEKSEKSRKVDNISPETNSSPTGSSDSRGKTKFYQRVETYSPVTWCAKPVSLSPLDCARYGWENVDIDMLQCNHCRAFLCGQLPKSVTTPSYKDSCTKLKQNLIESHEKMCKWASNPSPESFTQVQYVNKKELYSEFCKRVISLAGVKERLPNISYSAFSQPLGKTQNINKEELDGLVLQISECLKEFDITCSETIIIYSMTGWAYHEPQKDVEVLQCSFCYRKVGLWNYRSKGSTMPDISQEEPPAKRTKLEQTSFDPVAGHRYWCPWLQVQTPPPSSNIQSLSPTSSPEKSSCLDETGLSPVKHSSDPAWIHIAKLFCKYKQDGAENGDIFSQMKWSPQIEGVRHIRQVLRDCTSPPTQRRTILNVPSPVKTP